jgi:hypothetical protein
MAHMQNRSNVYTLGAERIMTAVENVTAAIAQNLIKVGA